jgi:hypothetical protein
LRGEPDKARKTNSAEREHEGQIHHHCTPYFETSIASHV